MTTQITDKDKEQRGQGIAHLESSAKEPQRREYTTAPGLGVYKPMELLKPQTKSYLDIYQENAPYKPPTAEELERERKRQRATRVISAIGDGLSALANLHYTSRYAPNVEQAGLQLSARNESKWQRSQADRANNLRLYQDGYQRAMEADRKEAEALRDANLRIQIQNAKGEIERGKQQQNWNIHTDNMGQKDADRTQRENQFNKEHKLNEKKLQEQQRHNKTQEGIGIERNNISRQNLDFRRSGVGQGNGGNSEFVFENGERLVFHPKSDRAKLATYAEHYMTQNTKDEIFGVGATPEEIKRSIALGRSVKTGKLISNDQLVYAVATDTYNNPKQQNNLRKSFGLAPKQAEPPKGRTTQQVLADEEKRKQAEQKSQGTKPNPLDKKKNTEGEGGW